MKKVIISFNIILFIIISLFLIDQFFFNSKIFSKKYIIKDIIKESNVPVNQQITLIELNGDSQYFCSENLELVHSDDKKFCYRKLKIRENRGFEIDLTNNKILLVEDNKIIKIFPILHQGPEGKWFQTPTGYYRVGIKKLNLRSSLLQVYMPYATQIYVDFFMHGIPYFESGKRVSSEFTGGCLRFEDEIAKKIFEFAKKDDLILIYKTFDDLEIKSKFYPPVDIKNAWIQQRFNNPYRQFWKYSGDVKNLKFDYYQHTGVDFTLDLDAKDKNIYSIFDGKVVKIQYNDGKDYGLGNTIILEHVIDNKKVYSLYGHLSSIEENIKEGTFVKKGEKIGEIGNSGFGCQNYWRIGEDGCNEENPDDIHLHFEIKKAPVLENPERGKVCQNRDGTKRFCYGYTPDYAQNYGYINPIEFLFEKK